MLTSLPRHRMPLKTLLICASLITSCSLTKPRPKDVSAPPRVKIYADSFDLVWRSIQLAMTRYPIKVNDYDSGVIETGFIRGETAWVSPGEKENKNGGERYKITVRVVKGKSEDGQAAVQVTVLKRTELQKDFFSEFEKIPSDGLEELAIMYRIEREIEIEKGLLKIQK